MTDKPGVPPSSVGSKESGRVKFNLGAMVEQTLLAVYIKTVCQKKGLDYQVQFFEGVLSGFDSWFKALSIPQDVFDTIQDKVDKAVVQKRAEEYVEKVMGQQKRIIIPSGQDKNVAKVAKEIFDKQFKR
jgi:hypothetical protein